MRSVGVRDGTDRDGTVRTVGVKELKQNASHVLSDVEANGETLVTVSGRPVAMIVPLAARHRWISTEELLEALAPGDPDWLEDLGAQRDTEERTDPFETYG